MTGSGAKRYRRRGNTQVTAVRLELDTDGFSYRKWGRTQRCKPGDWIVNNGGDVYTVDAETFTRTYRMVSPGVYEKQTSVWAQRAQQSGAIATQEGSTQYAAGDYLVFNDAEGKDGYAITAEAFETLYEPEVDDVSA